MVWSQAIAIAIVFTCLTGFIMLHFLTGGRLAGWLSDATALIWCTVAGGNDHPVPSQASAQALYLLALDYKGKGWVEPARTACKEAIAKDPNGQDGTNARIFMNIALPKKTMTADKVQGNITAYNLMAQGHGLEAVRAFRELIKQAPDFEWPYGNLAAMYLDENNLAEAGPLIDQALAINPDYLNGLRYKADFCLRQKNYEGAQAALKHAMDCMQNGHDSVFLDPAKDEIEGQMKQLQLRQSSQGGTI